MNTAIAYRQYDRALPEQQGAEELAEAITARAIESMLPGGAFDPLDKVNLAEAVTEAEPAFWMKLRDALDGDARSAEPGALIRNVSNLYWLGMADAEKQIEKEGRGL